MQTLTMAIDKSKYQTVPGTRGGRYWELATGREVSRRQAIKGSQGATPEQIVKARREAGIPMRRAGLRARRTRFLEKSWRQTRHQPPRKDPRFTEFLQELDDIFPLSDLPKAEAVGWGQVLDDWNVTEEWDGDDWAFFFASVGTSD